MVDIVKEKKYRISEAAIILDRKPKTVYAMIGRREICVYRVNRAILIGENEIRRILEEGFTPARQVA